MKIISEKNNFFYLLFALVFFLLSGALVDQFEVSFAKHLEQAATVVMLAIALFSFRSSRHRVISGMAQLLVVFIIVSISQFHEHAGLNYVLLLMLLGFFIWTTSMSARQVLFTGTIDGHKIVGAICIYLLLGLIWTLLYLLLAEALPGAFNGLQQGPWYDNFSSLSYYSFVTLTTLGYGDISPALPITRFLAYMEAVVGVLYIAILVASLIGARMSGSNR